MAHGTCSLKVCVWQAGGWVCKSGGGKSGAAPGKMYTDGGQQQRCLLAAGSGCAAKRPSTAQRQLFSRQGHSSCC